MATVTEDLAELRARVGRLEAARDAEAPVLHRVALLVDALKDADSMDVENFARIVSVFEWHIGLHGRPKPRVRRDPMGRVEVG